MITATDRETLLAARYLVYSKIIMKEELGAATMTYPHLQDELTCIKVTRGLSVTDCRRLFALIRGVDTFDARRIVADDVISTSPHLAQSLISRRHPNTALKGWHLKAASPLVKTLYMFIFPSSMVCGTDEFEFK